jgi:hypothetical protein
VYSFRWSWKAYQKVYQKEGFSNIKGTDPHNPGPGTYSNFPIFGQDAKQVTLKGRHKGFSNTNPGPGTYRDLTSMPKSGINFYSKYKSINSGSIGPPASRFKDDSKWKRDSPGPGEYTSRSDFNKTGQSFLSKLKSTGTEVLSSNTKVEFNKKLVDKYSPGPGSYVLPSDFGYPSNIKKKGRSRRRASSQL